MNSSGLSRDIIIKLFRNRILIALTGFLMALCLYLYAKSIKPIYTARATVYSLTSSGNEGGGGAGSVISSMLGMADPSKSFGPEASINITELANSRNTREATARERVPAFVNKSVAELLIDNYNKTRSFFSPPIKKPTDEKKLVAIGADLIKESMAVKLNKNGMLELNFSLNNEDLISPITYIFIDKISKFYTDLKIKKARQDYDFTVRKIDSLAYVLKIVDSRAVSIDNRTLFTPPDKLKFVLPKENLIYSKERVLMQRNIIDNQREEARWRLEKVTPIIGILDQPEPPFVIDKPSGMVYAAAGFLVGILLSSFFCIAGLLYRYVKMETRKLIITPIVQTTTTISAP